ncbi:MAG TPA: transglycosylase domain-containing protein [Candidatus Saccharimonadales bacterium]|nr:transglycosylase domain-containing protein [Candidatus Saccharimonadales bacterium]
MSKNTGRNRGAKNTVTTRSGNTLKVNRTMGDRVKAGRAARDAAKASYLATLPKERWKRFFYRLRPKHLIEYWFSREGGIMALKVIGASIVVGFFITIGLFAYFRKDLPQIKDLSGNLGGNITYYDRTGNTLLYTDYNSVKRTPVNFQNISPYMKEATVAIEDKNFYKEGAFDVRGILRAAVNDATGGGALQGGSTITQQLVKLDEGWTDNRTITRKVKELILAVELERQYSKDDILNGYLNIAPYGGLDYGVESAAEDYFNTTAKNLTLPQAAMLAAIPQSPSYYSPYAGSQFNPAVPNGDGTFSSTALLARQHYILQLLANQGYISQTQAKAAMAVNVLAQVHEQQPKYQNIVAPYYVEAAKQQLIEQYGASTVARGGWKVITALDLNLQNKANEIVARNLPNITDRTDGLADQEATVLENVPTGQVEALVGGVNWNNPDYGQINYATQVNISPGSTFKPYDYTTLFNNNNNVGASSVMYDKEQPLPGYPCTVPGPQSKGGNCLSDYDFLQPGPITLRYALGGSRNIPAVKAMLEAVPNDKSPGYTKSINKVISTATAMMDNPYLKSQHQNTYNCYVPGTNIFNAQPKDETQCYASSAIGDGAYLHLTDDVNGLSTLGREGKAIPQTFILSITDSTGKNIYQWKQPQGNQVVQQDAAYIVDNMTSDPKASYLPGYCSTTTCTTLNQGGYKFQRDNGWTFSVKTGTTNSGYDGLMASWSPEWATVSWVGNHTRNVDITSKTGTTMEYLTEPITRGMMEMAHAGEKPVAWPVPKDIKILPSYVQRNHIHFGDEEPGPSTDLYPSWYVGGGANSKSTSSVIDRVSGLTATSCTPADARETVYNADIGTFNIDIFDGGKQSVNVSPTSANSNTAVDNVHNCNDSPPTITLTAPSDCVNSCQITATVTQGTHPLTDSQYPDYPGTVEFTLDGKVINKQYVSNSPSTVSFTYTPTTAESATIKATVTDSVLYSATDSATVNFTPQTTTTTPTTSSPAPATPTTGNH